MLTTLVTLLLCTFVCSAQSAVLQERLSDRLISSQRVDEALDVCGQLLGERLRANQVSISAFQDCLFAYVRKMARELDGVELVYPRSIA